MTHKLLAVATFAALFVAVTGAQTPHLLEYGGHYHLSSCSVISNLLAETTRVSAAQVSEKKYRPCIVCRPDQSRELLTVDQALTPKLPPALAPSVAGQHVGKSIIVEGLVVQVSREPQSGFTYLNFGEGWPKHSFRVVIPTEIEPALHPVFLQTGVIRVSGVPRLGPLGRPEILCRDVSQLSLVTAVESTAPAARPALTAPVTPASAPAATPTRTCCRVCTTGKPCGDSCIARTATCRQPAGCAC